MRLLCAAAVSLVLGLWIAFVQDKKPAEPKTDRAARFAELKKKFEETNAGLVAKRQKAESEPEARGAEDELRDLALLTAGQVLAVAEADPTDETGFDAAAFIVQTCGQASAGGVDAEKAAGILAEHHINNPKMKDLLIPALRLGTAGQKLLKAVGEKSTDNTAKGTALFLRGYVIAQNIDEDDEEHRVALQVNEAVELMEQGLKFAPQAKPNVKSPTIGELAPPEIDGLKSIALLRVGKPAPEVESLLLDGKKVKLSDYKGKVVLLDVWATWCSPCVRMIPHSRELVKKLKDKPFVLVSVSTDKEKDVLTKFMAQEEMPWVHWWDNGPRTAVMSKYRVRSFPTLYLIDHTGVIRQKWVGQPQNTEKFDAAIEEAVKAAEKAKG